MLFFITLLDGVSGNGAKAYQCVACAGLITHSDRLLLMGGSNRHLFVNPAGVECDFHTFSSCPGAIASGEATAAHTWFPGYLWRMAFCSHCGQHLGWFYESASGFGLPAQFWGIFINHLIVRTRKAGPPDHRLGEDQAG